MMDKEIRVSDVRVGDLLAGDTEGTTRRIVEIGRGMPRGTIELRWRGGWQALSPSSLVLRVEGDDHGDS